jgi:hypothetical protein
MTVVGPGQLVVVMLLTWVASGSAQVRVVLYGDDRLAGIHEVDVVVTVSADATGRCPIARPALQTDTRDTLRANRIRATGSEKASSWHHTVQVAVQTRAAGTGCASAVTTELVTHVEGFPEADKVAPPGAWGSILIGPMTLVREIDLVTSAPREHDAAVQAAVSAQAAALAERVRRANP